MPEGDMCPPNFSFSDTLVVQIITIVYSTFVTDELLTQNTQILQLNINFNFGLNKNFNKVVYLFIFENVISYFKCNFILILNNFLKLHVT